MKRKAYFRRQRLFGLGVLLLAIISAVVVDIAVGVFLGILCIPLIFSKDMIMTDEYFYEVEEERESYK